MRSSSLIGPILGGRTKQGLKDSAVQYCLRVIDQCERSKLIETVRGTCTLLLILLFVILGPSKSVDDDLIDAVSEYISLPHTPTPSHTHVCTLPHTPTYSACTSVSHCWTSSVLLAAL